MVEKNMHPQRLYLSKGENDEDNIYIDTICLPQHQYDGIRFLFKLFKKGKTGAILNDPSGYGKRVQTVLFLNALRPVMTLPMLILCTESREQTWNHRFNKWTNMGPDVSVQKSHEIVKPICVISTFYFINALSRREWGVVVVDDNNVSRDVLRSGFTTKFKIWLTSMDMKKNLQTFSLIYKWFYPKDRFIVEDFQPNKKTPSVLLTKSAKLDAFMEDIVIRRRNVTLPLGKAKQIPHTPQITRKNKDATGKKIKRSKPLPEHSAENAEPQQKVAVQFIEDIERKNESIEDFAVSVANNKQTKLEIDFTLLKHHERDFTDKFDDNNEQETSEVMEELNKDNSEERNLHVEYYDGDELLNNESLLSQDIIIKYDSDTPEIDDDDIPPKKFKQDINSKNDQIDNNDLISIDTLQSDKGEIVQNNDIVTKSDQLESKTNDECIKNDEIHSENVFSADITVNEVKNDIEIDDFNRNVNEVVNKNNVSDINKTDGTLDGVELKMKQMEELAMKKFKGSVLDNLL